MTCTRLFIIFILKIFDVVWAMTGGQFGTDVIATQFYRQSFINTFIGAFREFEIFDGAIIGLTVGIAQWVILRSELSWTGWWIIFSIVGWSTGLTLLPSIMTTGTIAGVLTGIALEILLRQPRLKKAQT